MLLVSLTLRLYTAVTTRGLGVTAAVCARLRLSAGVMPLSHMLRTGADRLWFAHVTRRRAVPG